MGLEPVKQFAPVGVCVYIGFLSYGSQYLLRSKLEPGPPSPPQLVIFNSLVGCIWICYLRACSTPAGIAARGTGKEHERGKSGSEQIHLAPTQHQRWCTKCEAPKPPRAHHCKECQRCIPKMDHHCPWTLNCVSYSTFPHFIRFIFYAVAAMSYLEYFLYLRAADLWENRALPSYLGPTVPQLLQLFVLIIANTITLFALSILLIRSAWSLAANTTTIEGWEIDRHHALVRRARILGGYAYGPDGIRVRVKRQEFPYDIGIWKNVKQGMGGSANIPSWFWPLAATPSINGALILEVNGFEDDSLPWPPLDPERIPRSSTFIERQDSGFTDPMAMSMTPQEQKEAFHRRQQADISRRKGQPANVQPKRGDEEDSDADNDYDENDELAELEIRQEPEWRNSEGDRLKDFGVDEETEILNEDEVPLGELLRRRKSRASAKAVA